MKNTSPAEKILIELGVTSPEEINLEAISWHCGASIIQRRLKGCEAQIVGAGDRAVIIVNAGSSSKRRRFSIGHELGHWHFHRGSSAICRKDEIGNWSPKQSSREKDADRFSADLLLPNYLFYPLAQSYKKICLKAVKELSDAFDASISATAIRLVDSGVEPAILVCHSPHGRQWFVRGREVPDRWFPRDDLDADSAAFDVVFGSDRETRPTLIGADAWFNGYRSDQYELFEQSIKLWDDKTITLLTFKDEEMLDEWR